MPRRFAVRLDGLVDALRHLGKPVGDTQRAIQQAGCLAVLFQRQAAMQAQGLGRHGGGDVWISIAVAANPRCECQKAMGWPKSGKVAFHGRIQVAIDAGQCIPESIVEVKEAGAHLVSNGRP